MGGWRFGNTMNGCQAEYVLVPNAQANLAKIPDELADEDVLLCPDVLSTGFAAAERAPVRMGDAVAVFAQGPIGQCAAAGARLSGAALVIGVDGDAERLEKSKRMGVDVAINYKTHSAVAEIKRLTGGGADVAIEALGDPSTFEDALRSLRPGGVLSSLGIYAADLRLPIDAMDAGLGDHTIMTTLCPGGKERMRRLMAVVRARRFPFRSLVTHTFTLDEIEAAYDLVEARKEGVMKVAIRP
jgi:threonine dehydrogenase-like Zn-dependent dehydrogenase